MAVLIIFLALYALVTMGFFVALLRWTIRSERGCACGGTMQDRFFGITHSPAMCYPSVEALPVR